MSSSGKVPGQLTPLKSRTTASWETRQPEQLWEAPRREARDLLSRVPLGKDSDYLVPLVCVSGQVSDSQTDIQTGGDGQVPTSTKCSVAGSWEGFAVKPRSPRRHCNQGWTARPCGGRDLPPWEREGGGAGRERRGLQSCALPLETTVMFVSLGPLGWVLIGLCRNPDPKGGTWSSLRSHPCSKGGRLMVIRWETIEGFKQKTTRAPGWLGWLNRRSRVLLYTLASSQSSEWTVKRGPRETSLEMDMGSRYGRRRRVRSVDR